MLINSQKRVNLNHRNNLSYKDIKITRHALERANTRFRNIKETELKKIAASAKKNGINISSINKDNLDKYGISPDVYNTMKRMISVKNNSTKIYLYKGLFFVFAGNSQKTLKTIVEIYEKHNKGLVVDANTTNLKEALKNF